MAITQNRVIHRFIRPIADYEEGGIYYSQVIPIDTQAYVYYPEDAGRDTELWYVFGDGIHTYTEIRDGKGITESAKEFPVFTQDFIDIITNTYSKEEVDKLISHIHSFKVEIVDELPETGENNILYLVSKDPDDKNLNKPEGHNYYDEYVWIDTYFEYIGNTSSAGNFVTHEELDKILQTELSAEYIKYSFFNNNQNIFNELNEYFYHNYYSPYGIRVLFSRILYPSFYFNTYDKIISGKVEEQELNKIISKINNYEIYLYNIYLYLKKYYNIPSVEWLKKTRN